jgi:hypothetical protein
MAMAEAFKTACSRPNWYATKAFGGPSTTWRSRSPSTSTGSITAVFTARSALSRPLSSRPSTTTPHHTRAAPCSAGDPSLHQTRYLTEAREASGDGARLWLGVSKGGRAELIGWETRTARLLPRHLAGREQGPLFLTDLAPAPARQPAAADLDPASGHARLSYRRAAQLFRDAPGGWTLHQLRHSRLTHVAEAGVQLPILMAKSRHTSLISLAVYAQPTFDAVAAATAPLDPDRRH